jgi:chromosome segregation ATPase
MNPLALPELHDLLHGRDFVAWWTEHHRARSAVADAALRAADLDAQVALSASRAELTQGAAIDALAAVGELEDAAARLAAEAQALENGSLEAVAAYEEQRQRVSDLWLRLGGAERVTDRQRRRLAEVRARPAPGGRGARDVAVDLADEEELLSRAGHRELSLDEEYRREDARKAELWREVERLWAKSLELALLVAERTADARRRHREAERLFREAEERKGRVRQLEAERDRARRDREEADRALAAVVASARARFGCIPGERFLYFARSADASEAWAVALADDADAPGGAVRALAVYAVGREHGVLRLGPAEGTA